ncbi:MAG: class I SAM-dependent methyltransferase [Candidatus Helarchaeota archaeon]|nr:class I SAM-dependent methyltransferase [Candidatus Helarchaeota archaeon]
MSKSFFIKSGYDADYIKKVRNNLDKFEPTDIDFLKSFHPKDDELILDLCAGEGRFAKKILEIANINYVGLDISHKILLSIRDLLDSDFTRLNLITADAENLPFKNCFNQIFCLHSFFFIPNRFKALNEIRNSLSLNGIMILDVINLISFHNIRLYIINRIKRLIRFLAKKSRLIYKIVIFILKREYRKSQRSGNKGNYFIYLWELKRLSFKKIHIRGYYSKLQEFLQKITPKPIYNHLSKVLVVFNPRLFIKGVRMDKTQFNVKIL